MTYSDERELLLSNCDTAIRKAEETNNYYILHKLLRYKQRLLNIEEEVSEESF